MKLHPFFKSRITKHFCTAQSKITVNVTQNNLKVSRGVAYNEVTVQNTDSDAIKTKTFIFDNREKVSQILSRIQAEYQNQIQFNDQVKAFLSSELKAEASKTTESSIETELKEISATLKLSREETISLIEACFEAPKAIKEHRLQLQHQYFTLCNELAKLEKLRGRVESKVESQITLRLALMVALLIAQTALFYHWIYNVEDLGWDLVEPMTFLVSSGLFLISVFLFVKFNKNYYSFETMSSHWKDKLFLRHSLKFNFNKGRYDQLLLERQKIKETLRI